jgi:putative nucleotidyltransferase with HDIG domain
MTVPTRAEALALLLAAQPSERLLQHVTVVAEVASCLAHRAVRAGLTVDRRLIETAALLHDIDKALPADDALRELGHGKAGAAWLQAAGHPELARPIAAHPVMQLDEPGAHEWLASAPLEDRIVCYADKRATQRVVSLDQRFARWERRHPEYADRLRATLVLARQLETDICAALDIRPEDVERLPWVADAMARARVAERDLVTDGDGRTPITGQALVAESSAGERVPVGPRRLT